MKEMRINLLFFHTTSDLPKFPCDFPLLYSILADPVWGGFSQHRSHFPAEQILAGDLRAVLRKTTQGRTRKTAGHKSKSGKIYFSEQPLQVH